MGSGGRFGQVRREHGRGCAALHASALVRTFFIVVFQIDFQIGLHLVNRFVELCAALDAEVFIQQGAVESLDEAVGLWPTHARGSVFDAFQLQEQFVGVAVGPPAELAAIVAEHGLDPRTSGLERGQHFVVERLHGGDGQLVGVEPAPSVARAAVDDRLQVDAAHALERADHEGIDGDQLAGAAHLDLPFAELGAEALEQFDLLVAELDFVFADVTLQAQQALVFGQQVVATPDAAHAARADLDAAQHERLGHAQASVGGMVERVVEHGLFDLLADAVGVRSARAGQAVDQAVRAVGLEVAADLVELLARVSHRAAGLRNAAQLLGQL